MFPLSQKAAWQGGGAAAAGCDGFQQMTAWQQRALTAGIHCRGMMNQSTILNIKHLHNPSSIKIQCNPLPSNSLLLCLLLCTLTPALLSSLIRVPHSLSLTPNLPCYSNLCQDHSCFFHAREKSVPVSNPKSKSVDAEGTEVFKRHYVTFCAYVMKHGKLMWCCSMFLTGWVRGQRACHCSCIVYQQVENNAEILGRENFTYREKQPSLNSKKKNIHEALYSL